MMNSNQSERGFTLVELTMGIAASAIIMLTVMSLMGMTQREWARGLDKAELMSEKTLAIQNMTEQVRSAKQDSVKVSAAGDTLKIGGGVRFYKNDTQSLLFQKPTGSFAFLESMVQQFKATTPVILSPSDTLKHAVKVTLKLQNNEIQDSTSVIIYPRAQ